MLWRRGVRTHWRSPQRQLRALDAITIGLSAFQWGSGTLNLLRRDGARHSQCDLAGLLSQCVLRLAGLACGRVRKSAREQRVGDAMCPRSQSAGESAIGAGGSTSGTGQRAWLAHGLSSTPEQLAGLTGAHCRRLGRESCWWSPDALASGFGRNGDGSPELAVQLAAMYAVQLV